MYIIRRSPLNRTKLSHLHTPLKNLETRKFAFRDSRAVHVDAICWCGVMGNFRYNSVYERNWSFMWAYVSINELHFSFQIARSLRTPLIILSTIKNLLTKKICLYIVRSNFCIHFLSVKCHYSVLIFLDRNIIGPPSRFVFLFYFLKKCYKKIMVTKILQKIWKITPLLRSFFEWSYFILGSDLLLNIYTVILQNKNWTMISPSKEEKGK